VRAQRSHSSRRLTRKSPRGASGEVGARSHWFAAGTARASPAPIGLRRGIDGKSENDKTREV